MLRHLQIASVFTGLSCGLVFAADNIPRLNVDKTCRGAYGALLADTSTISTGRTREKDPQLSGGTARER